jgi:Undecaprenyl-phosphate glucose phosphotransferase
MLRRYQRTIGDLFRLVDAGVVVAVWLASYWVRFHLGPVAVTKGLPDFETYAALSPLVAVLWVAVFSFMRVYESRRMVGRADEVRQLLQAHGAALLSFIAVTYFFEDYRYSRLVMVYFAVLGAVSLTLFRTALRTLLRQLRAQGYNLRHVLAVGEGPALERLIQRLDRYPELGLRVRGVVTHEHSEVTEVNGKPVLGHFANVASIIEEAVVDEVLVALPASQQPEIDRLLELLKDETIDIRIVPDLHRYITLSCDIENFDGMPVVRLNDSPMEGWGAALKRVTDLLVSAIALAALSPLMLTIGLAVKLTSRGPVFYGQERMGLDGRSFKMFKFRSMRADAERVSGAVWAQAGDDRRTPIGAFLRRTSLDELPQFWNVLCGDMSLVGPRPERPVFVKQFRHEIPHYMLRHKVKAGITGWAQVNGWRGNTSLSARIECDLHYIRHWSYGLDLRILVMTLWKGFVHKNAY